MYPLTRLTRSRRCSLLTALKKSKLPLSRQERKRAREHRPAITAAIPIASLRNKEPRSSLSRAHTQEEIEMQKGRCSSSSSIAVESKKLSCAGMREREARSWKKSLTPISFPLVFSRRPRTALRAINLASLPFSLSAFRISLFHRLASSRRLCSIYTALYRCCTYIHRRCAETFSIVSSASVSIFPLGFAHDLLRNALSLSVLYIPMYSI